jgi:hypothetical protein
MYAHSSLASREFGSVVFIDRDVIAGPAHDGDGDDTTGDNEGGRVEGEAA